MKRVAAFALLLLVGCGHKLTFTPLNASPRPLTTRSPESVDVFLSQTPPRQHVEVGLFEIEQQSPQSGGTPEMIAKLRDRAARVGCDAIVLTGTSDRVQSVSTQGTGVATSPRTYQHHSYGTVNVVRSHRATCVVYTGELASAPPAVAPVATPAPPSTGGAPYAPLPPSTPPSSPGASQL